MNPLIFILLVLLITAVVLWLFNNYIPVADATLRKMINVVIVLFAIAFILWKLL